MMLAVFMQQLLQRGTIVTWLNIISPTLATFLTHTPNTHTNTNTPHSPHAFSLSTSGITGPAGTGPAARRRETGSAVSFSSSMTATASEQELEKS